MQTYTTGISLGVSAPILQVWVEYSTLVSVLIPDTGIGASLLQLLLLLITVIIILIILPHILTWLSGSHVKSIETCVGYFFQYLSSRLVLSGVEGSWCCSVPALTLPVRSREKQISILVLILFSSAPCSCVSSSSPPQPLPPAPAQWNQMHLLLRLTSSPLPAHTNTVKGVGIWPPSLHLIWLDCKETQERFCCLGLLLTNWLC